MNTDNRPSMTLYHPTRKGTGAAMRLELNPAKAGDPDGGDICATIAPQVYAGNLDGRPRFDWDEATTANLKFLDLCKMLQVFRGECESLEDGLGLTRRYPDGMWRTVKLRHRIEPVPGYEFTIREFATGNDVSDCDRNGRMFLSPPEALGICVAIEQSLASIVFGIADGSEAKG